MVKISDDVMKPQEGNEDVIILSEDVFASDEKALSRLHCLSVRDLSMVFMLEQRSTETAFLLCAALLLLLITQLC